MTMPSRIGPGRATLGLVLVAAVAITGCAPSDPGERACTALRDRAAAGDVGRQVYAMSPDERRAEVLPIADDAAAADDEAIRAAGYALSAGMDDPRAAVLGLLELAKACGPAQ